MVDVFRAYRRWMWRRFLLLGSALAGTLAVFLRVALAGDSALWLRISFSSVALLLIALLGYLTIRTASCARLQRRGRRDLARPLRRELRPYRAFVGSAAILTIAVLIGSHLVPVEPTPGLRRARRPPQPAWERAAVSSIGVAQIPPPAPAPVAAGSRPCPSDLPVLEKDLPVLVYEEQGFPVARRPEPERSRPVPDEAERLIPDPGALFRMITAEPEGISRKGLPPEGSGAEGPPPELRLDVLYLADEDELKGPAANVSLDYPLGRDDSIRVGYFLAMLSTDEGKHFDLEPSLEWERWTVTYARRVAGYTRHAAFDLAVSGGLSVDLLESPEGAFDLAGKGRLSPYAGLDVGLWREGPVGVLFHAGRSFPLNLTGVSSGVTDLSVLLRVDLLERLSFHIGFRMLYFDFRDYSENLVRERPEVDEAGNLYGPLLGLDFRI